MDSQQPLSAPGIAPWRVTGAFDIDGLPPATADDTLVDRIKWTTLARVVLITAVLVFAAALDLGIGPQRAAQVPEVLMYQWAASAYAASFVLLLATHLLRNRPSVVQKVAFASLVADALIALALVYISDGLQSMFQFALPLAVLNSAVVLARAGAVTAATLLLLGTAAMAANEVGWVALPRMRVAFLTALPPHVAMGGFEAITDWLVQGAAAYATAFLSSHLVMEVDRARRRSQLQRRELATLKVRFDDVVSSLPDGLLTLGPDNQVTSANPAALEILGCGQRQLVGKPLADLVPAFAEAVANPPGEWEITRAVGGADVHKTQELQRKQADGSAQILACRLTPLRDQGGQWGKVVVFRDITRNRRRDAEHQARERLAAIGAMATAVAHEIRNPLASISGAVQLLETGADVAEGDRALMAIVQRETSQLNAWIGEFLDFARPRPLQLGHCDLAEIVRETVDACRQDPRVQNAGTELAVHEDGQGDDGRFVIHADAVLLRQTVWNLLTNACQAVLEGEDRRVVAELRRGDDEVELAVEDSGRGIPTSQQARVFEPFFTTKGEGTGLGLALVERNVQSHRGAVQVQNGDRLGGARFVVRLPVRPPVDDFAGIGRSATRNQMLAQNR